MLLTWGGALAPKLGRGGGVAGSETGMAFGAAVLLEICGTTNLGEGPGEFPSVNELVADDRKDAKLAPGISLLLPGGTLLPKPGGGAGTVGSEVGIGFWAASLLEICGTTNLGGGPDTFPSLDELVD
jgi:hypothetical protein